jgi:hypothetical protein
MIIPPFLDTGEGGATFHCLAFAPIRYRPTQSPEFPAVLGIFFCSHKDFTRFSRISFDADGGGLSYTRGNDRHDNLEFLLLVTLLEYSVHPAMWRLFPRSQIPAGFRSDHFEAARADLCRLLFHFRGNEMAARLTADLPHHPIIICDESAGRVAAGDSEEEDLEIEKAIMEAL